MQERTYHEAHATLRVIDGKEKAPLSELVPEDTSAESVAAAKEKQENIATKLSMYLGETRDDRLYVRQARRVTICERSRSGVETEEPGTELIVCVRRERNKESVPTILMQKLAVLALLREPARIPGAIDAEAKPDRIDFLTHRSLLRPWPRRLRAR